MPAGTVHASFNAGDGEARLLAVFGPSVGTGFDTIDMAGDAPWSTLRATNRSPADAAPRERPFAVLRGAAVNIGELSFAPGDSKRPRPRMTMGVSVVPTLKRFPLRSCPLLARNTP